MKFKRAIILDDNETAVFVNKDAISEYFDAIELITFNDPVEFISEATLRSEWFSEPTLLFLDINMPNWMGFEIIEHLEDRDVDMDDFSVVIVTSSNLRRDLERASRFPCIIGYVDKPLTIEKLNSIFIGNN